jgi:hypothetical protein
MMAGGFQLKYAAVTGQFAETIAKLQEPIADAATGAVKDAVEFAKKKGRANIASAGFGPRWQNALRGNAYPSKGKTSLHPAGLVYHKIPYAGVFEQGATIAGSPLLWLPLPDVPKSVGGRHMSPANFVRLIGPLRAVFRPGHPPLLVAPMSIGRESGKVTVAKLRAGAKRTRRGTVAKLQWIPVFFGIDTVRLAKRFNLQPIFNEAVAKLGEFYLQHLKAD